MRYIIIVLCVELFILQNVTLSYDDSTLVKSDSAKHLWKEKLLFIHASPECFGIGMTFWGLVELQAGTYFFSNSTKIKLFLFYENSSPFVGAGIGNKHKDLGGGGEPNEWKVLFVGWQTHPFNKPWFLEIYFQYPMYDENPKASLPTKISFSVGSRLF